jgi:integrase
MLSQGIAAKAVRDVWLAAPRSVASYMVNALKLETNPFAGIKVDGVKAWKEDDERGFDPDQALTILSATVATSSHLTSKEMKAARRWVPWICAYTGARVNEITSLLPSDVQEVLNRWLCVPKTLNPTIVVMKSAQDGVRTYETGSLNRPRIRRIFV